MSSPQTSKTEPTEVDAGPISADDLRQLSAAVTHEIRSPLNTMAIHCELLEARVRKLDKAPDRDAALRSLGRLTEEVQRIDQILENFLAHAGPAQRDREQQDAATWIASVVEPFVVRGMARRVKVVVQHNNLGRWSIEPISLGRALAAVLDNAVWAAPSGSEVTVSAEADEERAVIRVVDRGIGIPKSAHQQLGQVGYTTRRGHLGLGLAIARQIIRGQHGGELRFDSLVGQGTQVTIGIPLEDEV